MTAMKPARNNKRPILLSETLDALRHMIYYIAFLEPLNRYHGWNNHTIELCCVLRFLSDQN